MGWRAKDILAGIAFFTQDDLLPLPLPQPQYQGMMQVSERFSTFSICGKSRNIITLMV
jgi:ketosteroid isomerase-like protein